MKRSTDRILTTHSGSLIRTRAIVEGIRAQTLNLAYDEAELTNTIRGNALATILAQVKQIPNDL